MNSWSSVVLVLTRHQRLCVFNVVINKLKEYNVKLISIWVPITGYETEESLMVWGLYIYLLVSEPPMHLVVLAERKSSHCCRGIMILIGLIDGTRFNFLCFLLFPKNSLLLSSPRFEKRKRSVYKETER